MAITLYLAPLFALIGALVYLLASNGKAQEIGRILFFAGIFATLLLWGSAGGLAIRPSIR